MVKIHVVAPGESVFSIARNAGIDPNRLAADNSVPPDGALAVGQTLVLQFPREMHLVRRGETLASIALQYATSPRALLRNNWQLGGNPDLMPGETLVISYENTPLGRFRSNSYAYPFVNPDLLHQTLPFLTEFTPFTYGVTAEGALLALDDAALLVSARRYASLPQMHLSTLTETGQFDNARSSLLLTNPPLADELIEEIVQTMRRKGYESLDVDFEYVLPEQREAYVDFLRRLRAAIAPLPLCVALAPKTSREQAGLLYEAHDYAAIGAVADALLLMTYEWGYAYSQPMAIAPLPSVQAVLRYALSEIPAEKIFLGIPNYGYDWPLPFDPKASRARSLSNQEAIHLAFSKGAAIEYDETAEAPHFQYMDGVRLHEVWFEDARSQAAKLRLIAQNGLRGAGYWNLMRPFSQTWLVLGALFEL